MSLPILVDGTVLTCVALVAVATNTVDVTPGSATNVISVTLKALIASDIENASGADDDTPYIVPVAFPIPGSGHFADFVIVTGSTTKFYDGSEKLHLSPAAGTCKFYVDTSAEIINPAPPPDTFLDQTSSYAATWTVNNHGQSTVYLKASP